MPSTIQITRSRFKLFGRKVRAFLDSDAPDYIVGPCLIVVLMTWLGFFAVTLPTIAGE